MLPAGQLATHLSCAIEYQHLLTFPTPTSPFPSPPHAPTHQVRPYLMADGGNVEFVEIDGPVVYLRLAGACGSCPSSLTTMTMGIKRRLMERIPVSAVQRPVQGCWLWGCIVGGVYFACAAGTRSGRPRRNRDTCSLPRTVFTAPVAWSLHPHPDPRLTPLPLPPAFLCSLPGCLAACLQEILDVEQVME